MNEQLDERAGHAAEQPHVWSPPASPFLITLEMLRALPEEFNAAIKLDHQLTILESSGKLPLMTLISLRPKMEQAFRTGQQEIKRVAETLDVLSKLPAVARLDRPPDGF